LGPCQRELGGAPCLILEQAFPDRLKRGMDHAEWLGEVMKHQMIISLARQYFLDKNLPAGVLIKNACSDGDQPAQKISEQMRWY
jgi:hypothetical protein